MIREEYFYKLKSDILEFRHMTLEDEIWVQETYPNYDTEIMKNPTNMDMICRIMYRLCKNKSVFKPIEVDSVDENGNDKKIICGGYKLLARNIDNETESIDITNLYVAICNNSRPVFDEPESKKKVLIASLRKMISNGWFLFFLGTTVGNLANRLV